MVEGVLDIGDEFGGEVQLRVWHGYKNGVNCPQIAAYILSIGCTYGWEGQ